MGRVLGAQGLGPAVLEPEPRHEARLALGLGPPAAESWAQLQDHQGGN